MSTRTARLRPFDIRTLVASRRRESIPSFDFSSGSVSPRVNELGKPTDCRNYAAILPRAIYNVWHCEQQGCDSPSLCHATGSLIQWYSHARTYNQFREREQKRAFLLIKSSCINVGIITACKNDKSSFSSTSVLRLYIEKSV